MFLFDTWRIWNSCPKRSTDSVDSPKEKVESTEANKSEITVRSVSVDGVSIADSV